VPRGRSCSSALADSLEIGCAVHCWQVPTNSSTGRVARVAIPQKGRCRPSTKGGNAAMGAHFPIRCRKAPANILNGTGADCPSLSSSSPPSCGFVEMDRVCARASQSLARVTPLPIAHLRQSVQWSQVGCATTGYGCARRGPSTTGSGSARRFNAPATTGSRASARTHGVEGAHLRYLVEHLLLLGGRLGRGYCFNSAHGAFARTQEAKLTELPTWVLALGQCQPFPNDPSSPLRPLRARSLLRPVTHKTDLIRV
jgi:hypothetical protein